jgi:hypothetical protein
MCGAFSFPAPASKRGKFKANYHHLTAFVLQRIPKRPAIQGNRMKDQHEAQIRPALHLAAKML